MKVVLVQLPVPNNRQSNLPLALGYLKAMAEAADIAGLRVELLDATAQNRGGDAFMVDAILAHDPDLVGFSLYTWNSSRILGLAQALKEKSPGLLILGGGPEVNRDGDFILSSPDFDFLILGEGERTFVELIQTLNKSGKRGVGGGKSGGRGRFERLLEQNIGPGLALRSLAGSPRTMERFSLTDPSALASTSSPWHFGPPRTALQDVNSVPSAYLSGALEGHLGRFMSIELSRWCPSKCTFCYYGRQDLPRGGKRYFDLERVRQELLFGLAHGVEQIHFVEANFNTLPHLAGLYDTIQATGANRQMRFYAELRGEAIDPAQARRLAECNFSTVEVGLQSAVPEVLARVRRKNHLPRLVQGVHNLRTEGIEVYLDVILGLPGETAETFRRTLAFVEKNDLQPYDLFHLQILSGTELKTEAIGGHHGMRWQTAPPYFVLETADLSFESLRALRLETLQHKGDDPGIIQGLPQPGPFALVAEARGAGSGGTENSIAFEVRDNHKPVERLVLDLTSTSRPISLETLSRQLGSEVTVVLRLGEADEASLKRAETILAQLSEPNRSGLWFIFAQVERPLSGPEQARLGRAIRHDEGYLDRLAVFVRPDALADRDWPSVSFFQVLPFSSAMVEQARPETVWQVSLEAEAGVERWQAQLEEAAAATEAGLLLVTPAGENRTVSKCKAVLQSFDPGSKRVWLADWRLAAGRAAADTDDNSDLAASLDFPLTLWWPQGSDELCGRPPMQELERAALSYQLAALDPPVYPRSGLKRQPASTQ